MFIKGHHIKDKSQAFQKTSDWLAETGKEKKGERQNCWGKGKRITWDVFVQRRAALEKFLQHKIGANSVYK